jgi:hypothetical protein
MKKRIFQLLAKLPFIGGVFARYEAAFSNWGERSWIQQSLQDARFDIDASTRQELQRRHRYWVSNSALVQKIRSLFIQFTVGPSGLSCVPNSRDEVWNETRHESFEAWSNRPEVSSLATLRQCSIQWAGQLFDDGEFFILKTKDAKGRPAIQTIESHRVSTPAKTNVYQGMPVYDGIAVDANGRPAFYAVRSGNQLPVGGYDPSAAQWLNGSADEFTWVKASDMIHKFRHRRPGQLRGIPEGFSCMNTLHDLDDLKRMEMQCNKLATEIGLVETNPAGELDATMNRRNRLSIQTTNAAGTPVTKNTWADYNVSFGGKKYALKSGDKLENFMVNRPTLSQQNYWDTLMTDICCGYETPKLLAMPYSLQGTVTRADLDVCANAYRAKFEIIADALREIYQWQGVWANDFDMSQDGTAPDDHHEVVIRPPRAPNVDIGYTAKALQIELELGVKTIQDVYAEKQQNWRVQLRQIAEAQAFVKELATEFGIDAGQITKLAVEQPTQDGKGGDPHPAEGDSPEANQPTHIYGS